MKPIIGITCGHQWEGIERYYVNQAYVTSILQAGGIPVLIPYMNVTLLAQMLKQVQGILIPGGIDIDANLFSHDIHPQCGKIDPMWDELDITVIRIALARNLPLLGICRGCQILNVACGGSLIQDIPSQTQSQINHRPEAPKWYATHEISIQPDSKLSQILHTTNTRVNSFHHQAVLQVAPGFQVTAVANDGIIEAIESVEHDYVIGVQWHPELMLDYYPEFKNLFSELIRAASLKY